MLTITRDDGYTISTDPRRIDVDRVHRWLSQDAYWALGRPRETVVRSVEGSLAFGAYRPGDGVQVAFARAVTDGATFCWLGDVYVDPDERGRGIGRWLVGAALDEVGRLGVHRILLATADAHGLYAGLGFRPLSRPDMFMELDERPVDAHRQPEPSGSTAPTAGAVTVAAPAEGKDHKPDQGLTVGR